MALNYHGLSGNALENSSPQRGCWCLVTILAVLFKESIASAALELCVAKSSFLFFFLGVSSLISYDIS